MIRKSYLISVLVLAGAAIPASATLTTYTSQSAFNTATSATQTFSNITIPAGALTNPYTDLVTSTVFSATTGLSGDANPGGSWPAGEVLEVTKCASGTNCPTLTISLASAVTSFDMFFGPQDFSNPTVTVNNSGGDHFASGSMIQPNGTTPIFFGFVTSTPITSFTIVGAVPADQWTFDSMQAGQADTPEAATLILVGGGLIMLRFGRRWLPRRTSTSRREPLAPAISALCPQSARG